MLKQACRKRQQDYGSALAHLFLSVPRPASNKVPTDQGPQCRIVTITKESYEKERGSYLQLGRSEPATMGAWPGDIPCYLGW